MTYPLMSKKEVRKVLPEARKEKVSEVSRTRGFIKHYLNGFKNKEERENWMEKRRLFIARTLPAYRKNPTYRRYLSLIMWAYKPKK